MEPMYVMAAWPSDPLAGLLVFGSGGPLICALVAALVGTILAVLREKSSGGLPVHDARAKARNNPLTAAAASERDAA